MKVGEEWQNSNWKFVCVCLHMSVCLSSYLSVYACLYVWHIPWVFDWTGIWGFWRLCQWAWALCLLSPVCRCSGLWCPVCFGAFLVWPALTFFSDFVLHCLFFPQMGWPFSPSRNRWANSPGSGVHVEILVIRVLSN